MTTDFHSHILPGIDDGSSNLDITKRMIDIELNSGVDTIVATPHYYCDKQSIEDFLFARNNAYKQVRDYYADNMFKLPDIKLGAEVYYSHYLNNISNIKPLCIEDTNYLLLELPYKEITSFVIDGILSLADNNGVNLVIAHIERYLNFTSYKSLLPLLNSGVLGQINCGSLLDHKTRKRVYKFIKDDYVHLIGTDAHNDTSRPPYMSEALSVLSKKFSPNFTKKIMFNATAVLNNIDIDDIY